MMRKFLIVGCGGSGGATVRLLMDQLQADLRTRGIDQLPDAWQFVHVDVPVDPDKGPGQLPDIVSMGGLYQSFSNPGNTYGATAMNVEARLRSASSGGLDPLLGWAPRDIPKANQIPVQNGAGQYRAVGRMLTLARLRETQDVLERAYRKAVAPEAWGKIPASERGSDVVFPIVVGSMAGGSGASMFLDVCRLLGTISGLSPSSIGCFLYTADVFGGLEENLRKNVEGNAMAALPELFAAISRLSDPIDRRAFEAFGISLSSQEEPPFARVLPIGRRVGETGAFFGDGTQDGIYRGVARAISGVMQSEQASSRYVDYFLGNPSPIAATSDRFGWGISNIALPFGSMGYASLSLGRDRYAHFAAQRLARAAADHLRAGHEDPTSSLPSTEQLKVLLGNQLSVSMNKMGLPMPGTEVASWFASVAYPRDQVEVGARDALANLQQGISQVQGAAAASWLNVVRDGAAHRRASVISELQTQAYRWAEGWATTLEAAAKEEFLRTAGQFGLPYARELMLQLQSTCDHAVSQLAAAGAQATAQDPVAIGPEVQTQVGALGKAIVGASHNLAELITAGWRGSAERRLRLEAARLGSEVLRSFATDVLGGLAGVGNQTVALLEKRTAETAREAGLAQLESSRYVDWPDESGSVPPRFEHALNEVLLTTAEHFPDHFTAHVQAASKDGIYQQGLRRLRAEVIGGVWETTGSTEEHEVLEQVGHWRPAVLNRSAADGTPTPPAVPRYRLKLDCADLVTRADSRVRARGSAFQAFASQSITDYLEDPSISQVEVETRLANFVDKFSTAMDLARPVIGLDQNMVQRLHGRSVQYFFTFSELPFEENAEVVRAISGRIASNAKITSDTQEHLKRAAGKHEEVRKIAIFGSYEKYSPLCYSSLLDGVRKRWASSSPGEQHQLWEWKRTRPLSGALAMSNAEAVRLVAGWYLGGALGLLKVGKEEIAVSSKDGWLRFPKQLATEEARMRKPVDALASVMMSHAWAVAQCSGDPDLRALAPYEALRWIADDSSSTATASVDEMSGTELLRSAVNGRPLRLRGQELQHEGFGKSLAGPDAESRLDGFRKQLAAMRQTVLSNGMVRADGTRYQASVGSESELRSAQLWVELNPIILQAFDMLDQIAHEAAQVADWDRHGEADSNEVTDLGF